MIQLVIIIGGLGYSYLLFLLVSTNWRAFKASKYSKDIFKTTCKLSAASLILLFFPFLVHAVAMATIGLSGSEIEFIRDSIELAESMFEFAIGITITLALLSFFRAKEAERKLDNCHADNQSDTTGLEPMPGKHSTHDSTLTNLLYLIGIIPPISLLVYASYLVRDFSPHPADKPHYLSRHKKFAYDTMLSATISLILILAGGIGFLIDAISVIAFGYKANLAALSAVMGMLTTWFILWALSKALEYKERTAELTSFIRHKSYKAHETLRLLEADRQLYESTSRDVINYLDDMAEVFRERQRQQERLEKEWKECHESKMRSEGTAHE